MTEQAHHPQVDAAVDAYAEMMRRRAELGPAVEEANRLARDLVEAQDPEFTSYLQRIAAIDAEYADRSLATQFHVTIGDLDTETAIDAR